MKSKQRNVEKGSSLFKLLFFIGFGSTCLIMTVIALLVWQFSRDLPNIISVSDYRPRVVTRILADNGKDDPIEIGEFYRERRYVIPFETIPKHVVEAFISAEDDRFFEHSGVNLLSI